MIDPPFKTRGQALAMLLALVATLVLPVLLPVFGLPSRLEVYRSLPVSTGPFNFIAHEIFEDERPIDLLLIGSSTLWSAIDARHLETALSERLGRPAIVRVLAANWPGDDLTYVLLRDVLEHRKVKFVVLGMPFPNQTNDRPHVQSFRWLRFGDDSRIWEMATFRSLLSVYASSVLGGPRQLVSALRPNRPTPNHEEGINLGGQLGEHGFRGAPFVRFERAPPPIPVERAIGRTATEGWFRVTNTRLGPYQTHFAKLIGELLKTHQVRAAAIHVPMWSDRASETVNQAMDWNDVLGVPMPIIGAPGSVMFSNLSANEQELLYYDEHLSRNGAEFFTRALTPAIVELASATE